MSEITGETRMGKGQAWKKAWQYLLLVLGGIAVNLVLSMAASKLNLPLYLDSIGTILVSVTGGFVPGIAVGYATNLLKAICRKMKAKKYTEPWQGGMKIRGPVVS